MDTLLRGMLVPPTPRFFDPDRAEFETSLGAPAREAHLEAGGRHLARLLGALGSGHRGDGTSPKGRQRPPKAEGRPVKAVRSRPCDQPQARAVPAIGSGRAGGGGGFD